MDSLARRIWVAKLVGSTAVAHLVAPARDISKNCTKHPTNKNFVESLAISNQEVRQTVNANSETVQDSILASSE
jgi:hypothetical protein